MACVINAGCVLGWAATSAGPCARLRCVRVYSCIPLACVNGVFLAAHSSLYIRAPRFVHVSHLGVYLILCLVCTQAQSSMATSPPATSSQAPSDAWLRPGALVSVRGHGLATILEGPGQEGRYRCVRASPYWKWLHCGRWYSVCEYACMHARARMRGSSQQRLHACLRMHSAALPPSR